jgi:hypothetical protein
MANTGFKGIDVRQTGTALLLRASLKDSVGAKVTTGTTTLALYEYQSDGTLKSYDFNDNTFKTTALTTATVNMTHRTGNNSTANTGLWSYALTTITGFTAGAVYLAQFSNSGASPTEQEREFQFGGVGEGDLADPVHATVANTHKEWRVRVGDGSDTTGNGSDSTPYATFRKPTLVGASYDAAEIGAGLYPVTTGCTFPQFFAVRGRGRAMTQVMIDNTGTPIHARNVLFEHLTIRFARYTFAVAVTGGSSGTITYTVSVGNQSDTVTVAYNASTATLQSAIEGLSFIGTNNAPVTGSPGAYTVTFARLLGTYLQPDEVRLSAAGSGGFGGTVTAYLTPTTFLLGAVNGDEPVRWEFNDVELIGESDVLEVPAYSDLSFTDSTIRTRVDMLHGGPLKRLALTRCSLINYGNTQSDPGNFTLSATGILSTTADDTHVTDTLIDVRDGIAGTYAVSVGAGQKFTMEGGRIHTQTVYGTPEYALVVDANAGPVLLIDVDINRSKVSDPGNKVQYLTRAQAMDWRSPIQATAATTIDNVTINSNATKINGTSIAGTGTRVADAFVSMLNVASPAFTVASVNQAGDSFTRIGALGAGLTALAPAATALSTAVWSAARAGYLDNLSVGGPVASQADVLALNTSSSKHLIITTVGQYERPESGSVTYTVEVRTYRASDGAAVNADTTPTLTATGLISGSLNANIGAGSNPATGVYRYAYTVASSATNEQVRFDVSAAISVATFTLSCYTQVVDMVASTWTTTDAGYLTAIFNKLPTGNISDVTQSQVKTQADQALADVGVTSTVTNQIAAIVATTDKVDTMLESAGAGVYRLTLAALNKASAAVLDVGAGAHNLSGTIGEKINTGGDGGTNSGDGEFVVTVTVKDPDGNELENVRVRMFEGANDFRAATDTAGLATFGLEAATYTLVAFKAGYQYTPSEQPIGGDDDLDIVMTAITIPPASDPDNVMVRMQIDGAPLEGQTIEYRMAEPPEGDAHAYSRATVTSDPSDVTGLIAVELRRNAKYQVRYNGGGWVPCDTTSEPDVDVIDFPTVLGMLTA